MNAINQVFGLLAGAFKVFFVHVFKISGFQCAARVSRFQGFRVSMFQGFNVSGFQCFRVSEFQCFRVSEFNASRSRVQLLKLCNHPIPLSLSLLVSQSPCFSVSQSLSLSVSQSPSLPVSQSLSLPVPQSLIPSFPQSPSLPVSQSPCLKVPTFSTTAHSGTTKIYNMGYGSGHNRYW